MSSDIIDILLQLAQDPIPNIRFNVAKSMEVLAVTFNSIPDGKIMIRQKIIPVLEAQKNDPDADVRYFAAKSLQGVRAVDTGEYWNHVLLGCS